MHECGRPNGYWKLLSEIPGRSYGKETVDGRGWGESNGLSKTWDEARKYTKLLECTGEISIKVVARLISIESQDASTV